jgi:excisionase family DNA binding protein
MTITKDKGTVAPVLLTPEETARALRIGRSKVYDLIRTGKLRSVKIDGSRRIPMSAITDFAARLGDRT